MADVYRGFDTQRHATVALKFMRPDFALDPDFERRFRREANTLAKLSHPNIVRYYDLERDGKELFMVMDYIDGISLQEHLFLNGPILSPSEVIAILSPVARALEYAHGQGVIHRDLKIKDDIPRIFTECGTLMGGVLIILGVALGLTNYLVDAEVPMLATKWAQAHIGSKIGFILAWVSRASSSCMKVTPDWVTRIPFALRCAAQSA